MKKEKAKLIHLENCQCMQCVDFHPYSLIVKSPKYNLTKNRSFWCIFGTFGAESRKSKEWYGTEIDALVYGNRNNADKVGCGSSAPLNHTLRTIERLPRFLERRRSDTSVLESSKLGKDPN